MVTKKEIPLDYREGDPSWFPRMRSFLLTRFPRRRSFLLAKKKILLGYQELVTKKEIFLGEQEGDPWNGMEWNGMEYNGME